MRFEVVIPFPPSANRIWRTARGRMIISKEYREFLTTTQSINSRLPRGWDTSLNYKVSILLIPQSNRKYDVDNRIKPTLDALTKARVWEDDSQVHSVTAIKGSVDKMNPRAIVIVTSLE